MGKPVSFAILAYDDVEPIDIGATYGILSMARRVDPTISMFVVAEKVGPVRMANDLTIIAHHGYDDCPPADVLMVLGGPGWPAMAESEATAAFIRRMAPSATVASVCTGGLILAASGLLNGCTATTKRHVIGAEVSPIEVMRTRHPDVDVVEARMVDCGPIVTGGGVTLAIDMTLHLLERLCGPHVAAETARITEYREAWRANKQAFQAIDANKTSRAAARS